MADKKRDILEFFEQMNFEQMIPTQNFSANLALLKIFNPEGGKVNLKKSWLKK